MIPVAVGLLNPNGDEVVPTTVLELTKDQQTFTFDNLASRPIPSILRGFLGPGDREPRNQRRRARVPSGP